MIGLSYNLYEELVPQPHVQKTFAKLLASKIKVLQTFSKIVLVGNGDSASILGQELSRILKCPFYLLPIFMIKEPDNDQIIYGAMSGTNDAFSVDLDKLKHIRQAEQVEQTLKASKYQMILDPKISKLCDAWLEDKKTIENSHMVLLIDSIIACQAKLRAAIESLYLDTVTRITPVSGLVDRQTFLGTTYPVRKGIFLKEFDGLKEMSDCSDLLNGMNEKTLLQYFNYTDAGYPTF